MDDRPDPKDIPPEATTRGHEKDATAVDDAPVIRDDEADHDDGPDATEAPEEKGSASPR